MEELRCWERNREKCRTEGCESLASVRGYCLKHYGQVRRHGYTKSRTTREPNIFIVEEDIVRIKLFNNKGKEVGEAIIDREDLLLVRRYKWHLSSVGKGYAVTSSLRGKNRKPMFLSRLLLQPPPELECDHKNGNTLDNRRQNLRVATHIQNMYNQGKSKNNKSGFKGVSQDKRTRRWVAHIQVEGRNIHLGCFADKRGGC